MNERFWWTIIFDDWVHEWMKIESESMQLKVNESEWKWIEGNESENVKRMNIDARIGSFARF